MDDKGFPSYIKSKRCYHKCNEIRIDAVNLLLPVFAFICGVLLAGHASAGYIKPFLASMLSRLLIPAVIIYNMVFYQAGSLSLMLFSFCTAIIMFYVFLYIFKDKLRALCVSYINLAWLGFPFALAIFGPSISAPMVALYVGGSVFGNIWAVTSVNNQAMSAVEICKKVLMSPPVSALILAAIFRFFGLQHMQEHTFIDVLYSCAKVSMSFAGMCVLGMWMRRTRVEFQDIWRSTKVAGMKLFFGAFICGLTYSFVSIPHIDQYIGVMFMLFFLPPAANIVALETHYQGTGVSAKYIASGTLVSCVLIALYGLVIHQIMPNL
jgi:malate permease and related proteins